MHSLGRFAGILLSLGAAGTAAASDYSHECRPADARYTIEDETLFETADPKRTPIPYEMLEERTLSERRGYCLAKGRRYEFQSRTFVQRIRFSENGETVRMQVACELATDGLPANLNCEREVVTLERKSAEVAPSSAVKPTGTLWVQSGSRLRLEAIGAGRRFVFVDPRPELREAGVKAGDVVFEGRREGAIYRGTAYDFAKTCGRTGYAVSGQVAADNRSVVVTGSAPQYGADCKIAGHRQASLEFLLTER